MLVGPALHARAAVAWRRGRSSDARRDWERALVLHRQRGDRREESALIGMLANLYADEGLVDEARAAYEEALQAHRELGNRRLEGMTLGNIGALDESEGQLTRALRCHQAALAIHREVGDERLVAHHSTNLASVLEQLGRREQAERWLVDALEECQRFGEAWIEANTLGTFGDLLVRDGRLAEAAVSYERALVLSRSAGQRRTEGIVLQGLGNLLRLRGERASATRTWDEAERVHREVGNQRHLGILAIERARLALDAGDAPAARSQAEAALLRLGFRWDPRDRGLAHQVLAAGWRLAGDLDTARTVWAEAWLDEPIRSSWVARSMLRAEEGRILLAGGDTAAAEAALGEAAALLGPVDRLARARVLIDHATALDGLGRRELAEAERAEAEQVAVRAGIGPSGELREALAAFSAVTAPLVRSG